jgi:antitoxin VapB
MLTVSYMLAIEGLALAIYPGNDRYCRYLSCNRCNEMVASDTAKLFKHGRSQAVRLPKEFRLPGTQVRVRRVGRGVLLEPMERDIRDIKAVFAEIDRLGGAEFLPEGRPEQPPMPPGQAVFDA